jgi:hypothetical protein
VIMLQIDEKLRTYIKLCSGQGRICGRGDAHGVSGSNS